VAGGGGLRKLKFLLIVACCVGALVTPGLAAAAPTIVSLTFDDSFSDQTTASSILAQHSMHGTFYVNTGWIGTTPSYLTWSQLSDIAAGGNEVGGHTIYHVDLTQVDSAEATRQVCDDRQALISHGFNATSFAYPFGSYNTSAKSIVQGCGYSSARRSWGLCPIGQYPPNCIADVAERIPPVDRYAMRTIASFRAWHTLADIQSVVTRAENNGGGWVTLVFHHLCEGCDPENGYSVSPAIFTPFLDWLQPRTSSGTFVRTVRDVISDTTPPTSSIACNGGSCSGWFGPPVSVSLTATDAGTAVSAIRYTTDGSTPSTSSPLYTGPFQVSTTTTVKYRAWDMRGNVEATKTQVVQVDATPPISSIACNGSACSSGIYTTAVSVSLSANDTGTGVAAIRYTTDGSIPTTSSPLYFTPFTVATTTSVKYRAWDVAGNVEATNTQLIQVDTTPADTTPPTSSIACNGTPCSGWYTAAVSVSLSANDSGSGVAAIRYTTDGTDPTSSSPLYGSPFSVAATTTVKYRAWDVAGNVEATKSQLVQIDVTAPTSSINCNGVACSSGTYGAAVSVSLSATDSGSGVSEIRYTTDGSDPTSASPLYSSPFSVTTTTTVKYRAWDDAGNVEATNSQLIQVDTTPADTTPPSSSIACNGASCSGWYTAAVSVSLSASDSGSGVAAIRYTTDGTDPTPASPLYSGPFSVPTTSTVKYRAWDVAGNVEATNSQLIQIDTAAPSSSIACNGAACSSGTYNEAVSVSLSATDSGSGVGEIHYTTDGSDPTLFSQLYTGPFGVATTTTVKFRAWDVAGNVEATNSQLIQVDTTPADTTPPSSSIACNGATCSGWYSGAVSVSLSATDSGSGVAAIRYTTDGTDPTSSSPLYGSPFSVAATATVKYRAWDVAGNVEATKSQLVQIDVTAPTSSINCNGAACSTGWYAAGASVSLSAADTQSGVAAIRYTTDGSTPTTSSPLYVVPFSVAVTTTVKYRAWDVAGNIEATRSRLIQVDTFPPTVSITSPANGATVTGNVKIIASAADAEIGLASVSFYADGTLIATSTSPPWQTPWNTKRSTPGQHVLTAVARDRAGNSKTSAGVTVTVR
jgi:peptidoglycan/xylan/chitin deacetylase (PgdA/CDA1 family)